LYRAALVALDSDGRIEIGRGDTEGECVNECAAPMPFSMNRAPLEGKANYFSAQPLSSANGLLAAKREIVSAADIEPLIEQWAIYFSIINRLDSALRKSPVQPHSIVAASIGDAMKLIALVLHLDRCCRPIVMGALYAKRLTGLYSGSPGSDGCTGPGAHQSLPGATHASGNGGETIPAKQQSDIDTLPENPPVILAIAAWPRMTPKRVKLGLVQWVRAGAI
jgi:hypothetical protein